MSGKEEFNMDEFEKRILQMEVTILFRFWSKLSRFTFLLPRTPTPSDWPARRGTRLLMMVLMMLMKKLMMSRWMRWSLAKVVEAMRTNDNWGFNNWRSCAGGHIYVVGRSFPTTSCKWCLHIRCGGPLEERLCPAEGCQQMIGGTAELLNASNR